MKNLARKKENISCLHSQNCQVAIYGAICLFSFFALFLLSNVCTHAVPNAFVSVFASVCLCLWGVSCFCCCGRCERVCVCGSGRAGLLHILQLCALKTCLLDISRHSHWARSTCRTYKAAGVFQGVTGYGFGGSRGQRSCSHWAEECNNTWNAAGKTERSDRHFFSRGVHNNKLEIIPKWC